jgi:hypothetical protein
MLLIKLRRALKQEQILPIVDRAILQRLVGSF